MIWFGTTKPTSNILSATQTWFGLIPYNQFLTFYPVHKDLLGLVPQHQLLTFCSHLVGSCSFNLSLMLVWWSTPIVFLTLRHILAQAILLWGATPTPFVAIHFNALKNLDDPRISSKAWGTWTRHLPPAFETPLKTMHFLQKIVYLRHNFHLSV